MYKKILLFIVLSNAISCSRDLEVSNIQICDLFTSQGECKEPWQKEKAYIIQLPSNKKIKTWEELSHYLYFNAKETPGLVIHWNRNFTAEEKASFYSKSSCYGIYKFYGHIGTMEGREIGTNWMGFFQYLGSILEEERKASSKWKEDFHLLELFPANLELGFHCNQRETFVPLQINLIVSEANP
ncbi:MAG: hypothetical protein CK427_02590 [Leptospira sp.]|nr:MAG: hypothetical protein CK427_02590 [Leptospira sp.]